MSTLQSKQTSPTLEEVRNEGWHEHADGSVQYWRYGNAGEPTFVRSAWAASWDNVEKADLCRLWPDIDERDIDARVAAIKASTGVSIGMTIIRDQVLAFHKAADQPSRDTPEIPDDPEIRCRLRLVLEECIELLQACGVPVGHLGDKILEEIDGVPELKVDLVGVADACGDIDYTVEGTRQAFGIDGGPVAAEIHRSNMTKFGPGSHKREDGKILKPPGWTPPDIAGELRKQGWEG